MLTYDLCISGLLQYCGYYVYYPIEEETKTTLVILLSVIATLVVTLAIFILLVVVIVFDVVKGGFLWDIDLTFSVTHTNKIK